MSVAVITSITQAVADSLNSGTFSQEFTAQRSYVPSYDLAKTPGLQVFVLGLAQDFNLDAGTRRESVNTFTVNVAVYRQVARDSAGQTDQGEADAVVALLDELIAYLKSHPTLDDADGATLVGIRSNPVYDPTVLDSQGTLVSVLALDYRTVA